MARRTRDELLDEDLVATGAPSPRFRPGGGAFAFGARGTNPWPGQVVVAANGAIVADLRCRTHPDGPAHARRVATSITWAGPTIRHPRHGQAELPLGPEFLLGTVHSDGDRAPRFPSRPRRWPLATHVVAGWLGLYGYEWRQGRGQPWQAGTRRRFEAGRPSHGGRSPPPPSACRRGRPWSGS